MANPLSSKESICYIDGNFRSKRLPPVDRQPRDDDASKPTVLLGSAAEKLVHLSKKGANTSVRSSSRNSDSTDGQDRGSMRRSSQDILQDLRGETFGMTSGQMTALRKDYVQPYAGSSYMCDCSLVTVLFALVFFASIVYFIVLLYWDVTCGY